MWTLARKLLLHDRLRFAVAIAGVSVSVMLVLVQVGLYFGFMDTASSLIDASSADLWVGKAGNESFEFASPFDERAFYKVSSVVGVERTERVLINFAQLKVANGGDLGVQVVGIETGSGVEQGSTPERSMTRGGHAPLLAPWNVAAGDASRLAEPGAIVVDRSEYPKLKIDRVGHTTEIAGVRARVVALTSGIRSFTTSPIVFADLRTARSYMPGLGPDAVTYVLVKVAPGASIDQVQHEINALPHLAAYKTSEMSARTRAYWSSRTGVGAGFFTTAVLGVIVGFVVVGQILYSGTLQYLREYGTLKAMGARNSMVVRVILSQAMISAALGFVVGGVLAIGMRAAMASANLTVALFPSLYAATLVVTIAMCSLASLLSIIKVFRLDPASVFKG
jgi:putative ABC transport system permease protein